MRRVVSVVKRSDMRFRHGADGLHRPMSVVAYARGDRMDAPAFPEGSPSRHGIASPPASGARRRYARQDCRGVFTSRSTVTPSATPKDLTKTSGPRTSSSVQDAQRSRDVHHTDFVLHTIAPSASSDRLPAYGRRRALMPSHRTAIGFRSACTVRNVSKSGALSDKVRYRASSAAYPAKRHTSTPSSPIFRDLTASPAPSDVMATCIPHVGTIPSDAVLPSDHLTERLSDAGRTVSRTTARVTSHLTERTRAVRERIRRHRAERSLRHIEAHSRTANRTEDPTTSRTAHQTALVRFRTTTRAFTHSRPVGWLIRAVRFLYGLWKRRMRFSYAFYAIVMSLLTAASVTFLQWSVTSEPDYADPDAVDATTKLMQSVPGQLTKFVSQMWMEQHMTWLLNFLVLGLAYLTLALLLNRFWIATAIFGAAMLVFGVANNIKVQLRNEPIIPSDLSFVSSGNSGEIMSFVPKDSQALVDGSITVLVWFVAACLVLQVLDGRRCVIPFHWWRPFRNVRTVLGNLTRVAAAGASTALLVSFVWNLGVPGAWSYEWAKDMNDTPILWNAMEDSQRNGPAMNFLRLAHAKTMEKPDDYSQETMERLAKKYAKAAQETNRSRANTLTDSTVIMILSETFSDPTRVPGISLLEDPMPNIRAIKASTTSGLMLSPGYGGGTANIEYQALTGLDLALFDDSMQSPYQELVPHQKHPFSFNQLWNERYGEEGSVAFHPYYKSMYLRDTDYKRFGFNHFYTLDSDPAINHQDKVDGNPYVSDAASYQNVLDQVNGAEHPQFIQLVTMQNHGPHSSWYLDNQFDWANISENLNEGERDVLNAYIKGVNITDQATADFLNQLDGLDKPVTVIFYGDHLPSDYTTAAADKQNALSLHETDYFIWSNQTAKANGMATDTATLDASAQYTSPNYFMELACAHMDAKASPYLAFLSAIRADLPAIERLVLGSGGFATESSTTYLDVNGNVIQQRDLSKQQKKLLHEYRLIQYDLTAGKEYLNDMEFFKVGQ